MARCLGHVQYKSSVDTPWRVLRGGLLGTHLPDLLRRRKLNGGEKFPVGGHWAVPFMSVTVLRGGASSVLPIVVFREGSMFK